MDLNDTGHFLCPEQDEDSLARYLSPMYLGGILA